MCFHIEPYAKRSAESVRQDIAFLIERFGNSSSFYRMNGKPCFFIYDSYLTPASEWSRLCSVDGDLTIRGTNLDSNVIGLWVSEKRKILSWKQSLMACILILQLVVLHMDQPQQTGYTCRIGR